MTEREAGSVPQEDVERLVKALESNNEQLQTYAADLKVAFDAMKHLATELEEAYYGTLMRLLRAARFKDEETANHLIRIEHYARLIAGHLGLPREDVERIAAASPLHDVGKIAIPDAILSKPGALDANEWIVMRRHPGVGASLMQGSRSDLLNCAAEIALTHHERHDGSGYPRGLAGDEIPVSGRIVMLADQYDALRSSRCYKPAFSHDRTCSILLEGDGRTSPSHFAPEILAAFRAIADEMAAAYEEHADPE